MNNEELRARIDAAIRVGTELCDLIERESAPSLDFASYDILRRMLDILRTDDDLGEVMKYAALTYGKLYAGHRNLNDFMISRPDLDEQRAENLRLNRLSAELGDLVHGR